MRFVALRVTFAVLVRPDDSDAPEFTRTTRLLSPRDVAVADDVFTTFDDAARGFSAWAAKPSTAVTSAAKTNKGLQKFAMRIVKLHLSVVVLYHFLMTLINTEFYSMQQFTAFFTQSPKRRTAERDSATFGVWTPVSDCAGFSPSVMHFS